MGSKVFIICSFPFENRPIYLHFGIKMNTVPYFEVVFNVK